jgi:poly-gamma-glutamate system protein
MKALGPVHQKRKSGRDLLIYGLALLSLVALVLAQSLDGGRSGQLRAHMRRAAEIMDKARLSLLACRQDKGLALDLETDINGTGLIGLEYSPLTTSLGILEAKRTTANPDMAALVVRLLNEAAVKPGDSVAIGASSSFPALILASLSACQALGIKPVLICSLGASQYGANDPAFTWLDMMDCLRAAGLMDVRPAAVSVGGDSDSGRNMNAEGRALLLRGIRRRGLYLLEEPDLARNVSARMKLYEQGAGQGGIRAFINIGGSWANMGTDSRILEIKPGLSRIRALPPPGRRGVLFEMAGRGVPVIHLLYIRGLAKTYGLAWDPSPLPRPGHSALFKQRLGNGPVLVAVGVLYSLLFVLALARMKWGRFKGDI